MEVVSAAILELNPPPISELEPTSPPLELIVGTGFSGPDERAHLRLGRLRERETFTPAILCLSTSPIGRERIDSKHGPVHSPGLEVLR